MAFIRTAIVLSSFCILFCQVSCKTDAEATSCVPWTIQPNTTRLRCGEVIALPNGTIFHKPYEPIGENERCVWTIPLTTDWSSTLGKIDFHILHMGFPSTNIGDPVTTVRPQLLFTALSRGDGTSKTVIPDGTGSKFTMAAQTVVITFSSGSLTSAENYTGFIVNFVGNFRPLVDPQNISYIQMPPAKMNFVKSKSFAELATFIFPPGDNYYPGGAYPLIFTENASSNNDTRANVNVYHFNASSVEKPWERTESFSSTPYTRWIAGHDDILLLTFEAGGNYANKDFELLNARCEPEEE